MALFDTLGRAHVPTCNIGTRLSTTNGTSMLSEGTPLPCWCSAPACMNQSVIALQEKSYKHFYFHPSSSWHRCLVWFALLREPESWFYSAVSQWCAGVGHEQPECGPSVTVALLRERGWFTAAHAREVKYYFHTPNLQLSMVKGFEKESCSALCLASHFESALALLARALPGQPMLRPPPSTVHARTWHGIDRFREAVPFREIAAHYELDTELHARIASAGGCWIQSVGTCPLSAERTANGLPGLFAALAKGSDVKVAVASVLAKAANLSEQVEAAARQERERGKSEEAIMMHRDQAVASFEAKLAERATLSKTSRGVLLVIAGGKYVCACVPTMASLRAWRDSTPASAPDWERLHVTAAVDWHAHAALTLLQNGSLGALVDAVQTFTYPASTSFWIVKLTVLLASPYGYTLALDCDIIQMDPAAVLDLLDMVSRDDTDLVYTQAAGHPGLGTGTGDPAVRLARDPYAHGVGQMCGCIVAWANLTLVRSVFEGAIRLFHDQPSKPFVPDGDPRRGDQQAVFATLNKMSLRAAMQLRILPNHWQCPGRFPTRSAQEAPCRFTHQTGGSLKHCREQQLGLKCEKETVDHLKWLVPSLQISDIDSCYLNANASGR